MRSMVVVFASTLLASSLSFAAVPIPEASATPPVVAPVKSGTPEQKKEIMEKKWQSMTPEQKAHFLKQKDKFQKIDPGQKDKIKEYWKTKTPEQKAKFKEKLKKMTPEEKKKTKEDFKKMTPEQRKVFMDKMFSQNEAVKKDLGKM